MPESFPSCFGDLSNPHVDTLSGGFRTAQNSVVCLYQTVMAGSYRSVSVTWCKNFLGQGFSVGIDNCISESVCKIDIRPWLFWKRVGSKSISVDSEKVEVFWDLSSAKYVSGPEPSEGFYVAIVCDEKIVLLLGDMQKEAIKRTKLSLSLTESALLSRKEHLFGKKIYSTKAHFGDDGRTHDIVIECHIGDVKEPWLCVRVDKQVMVYVQRLMWKFRGNQTILVDGIQVEVLWDVHSWLFNSSCGYAVFMFHTWETNDKLWSKEVGVISSSILQWPATHSFKHQDVKQWFTENSCTSVLEWPNMHSFKESCEASVGFSLLLYAWRSD